MNDNLSNLEAIQSCADARLSLTRLITRINRAESDAVLLQAAELRKELLDINKKLQAVTLVLLGEGE